MLIMEAIVIGLAIPVAIKLEHAPSGEAVTAGVVLAVAAVLLAAAARRGPLQSRSSTTIAAPALCIHAALVRWWSALAAGKGTRIAGRP